MLIPEKLVQCFSWNLTLWSTKLIEIMFKMLKSYLKGNAFHLYYKSCLVNSVEKKIAVYSENYMKSINTLCGQNA
jgi:activator of HSP90 ATPase